MREKPPLYTPPVRVPNPPPGRPLLVFDGDCSFCRLWIARWRRVVRDRVDYEPYQTAADRFPTLPVERFRRAVQLIEPDGRVFAGAEAAFRTLALVPGHRHGLWIYRRVPGARLLFELGYRWVAGHRSLLYRLSRLLFGSTAPRPGIPGPAPVAERRRGWRRIGVGLGIGLGVAALLAAHRRKPPR
ncbi:MAG TPA: DCC1-like thiol-disulfide oxidoreductase family protein [Thermoanaerobaculia bacterium]|nr:DCC1-like thiol-disulfide oxidoreductase family protein [Thermoanaerobaculia bacterium]